MWDEYMQFYQTAYTQELMKNSFEKLLSLGDTVGCYVACDENGELVGFLTYVAHFSTWKLNPICYLNDLYVKKSHRQFGVAKRLLDRLKDISEEKNWSAVYWHTKPDNKIARKFYDSVAESSEWIVYSITL
jgi:GNAT superfamily N-acetyltransferase